MNFRFSHKEIQIPSTITVREYAMENDTRRIVFTGTHHKAIVSHRKGDRLWAVAFFPNLDAGLSDSISASASRFDAYGLAVRLTA